MERQTTVGLSTAIINVFGGYFFGKFRDKASVRPIIIMAKYADRRAVNKKAELSQR